MLITPNKWSRPQTKIGTIKNIVVHWIGNAGTTAENNAKYFNSLKDGRGTYASSHYIIGNDGVVIRCVPENEASYKALIELLVDLCNRYKLEPTQAIIRHYDVTAKDCPRHYVKNTNEWKKLKQDVDVAMNKDEELERAVKVLQERGIISSPGVWLKGTYTKNNVRSLVVKVASQLK